MKKPAPPIRQAYKLYILETFLEKIKKDKNNSLRIESKYWDDKKDGAFNLLNPNSVNKLIQNAYLAEYTFPPSNTLCKAIDKKLGKASGNKLDESGKKKLYEERKGFPDFISITQQLLNITKNSQDTDAYINEIVLLLGIKTFDEFYKFYKPKTALLEDYESKAKNTAYVKEIIRKIQEHFESDKEDKIHFVFYYWHPKSLDTHIGRGSLECSVSNEMNHPQKLIDCHLTLYEKKDKSWEPREGRGKERAEIFYTEHNTYLLVKSPQSGTFIIHGEEDFTKRGLVYCAYCSTMPESNTPFAGIGLLEKSEYKHLDAKIQNEKVSENIFNKLFNQFCFKGVGDYENPSDLKITPFASSKDKIKYAGVYRGYYLDKEYRGGSFRTLLIEISKGGRVTIDDNEGSRQTGFCCLINEKKTLLITGDYDNEKNSRYQILLKALQETPVQYLDGIYGGLSKEEKKPIVGLLRLEKINDRFSGAKHFGSFDKTSQLKLEFKRKIKKDILAFFSNETFYSSPEECLALPLKIRIDNRGITNPISTGPTPVTKVKYNGPVGLFYLFSVSSIRRGMVKYSVLIHLSGEVEIKTKDGVKRGKASMHFGDKILTLDFFNYYDGGPFMGTFLFYAKYWQENFAPGVSARANDNLRPQAKREYLISYKVLENVGNMNLKNQIAEFAKSKFDYFYPGSRLFNKVKKLNHNIETLLGREYNLIEETTKVTEKDKLLRRQRYDKIYYNETILAYLKDKAITKSVRDYFMLSMEHGLYLEQRNIEYLKEFYQSCKLEGRERKNLETALQQLYKEYVEDYKYPKGRGRKK